MPNDIGEGSRGYTDGFTLFQVEVETDATVWIGRANEAFYHPRGDLAALLARSLVAKACAPFALTCLAKGERLYQVEPALAEGAES